MKQLIAYLVVGAFVFLATPSMLWHYHDHDTEHHDADHDEHSDSEEEDCFVCDFDIDSLAGSVQVALALPANKVIKSVVSIESVFTQRESDRYSSRGPPALS